MAPWPAALLFAHCERHAEKLWETMQAAEYRHLEVYASELEELTKAGDMKDWHGHLKGMWRLQGKGV